MLSPIELHSLSPERRDWPLAYKYTYFHHASFHAGSDLKPYGDILRTMTYKSNVFFWPTFPNFTRGENEGSAGSHCLDEQHYKDHVPFKAFFLLQLHKLLLFSVIVQLFNCFSFSWFKDFGGHLDEAFNNSSNSSNSNSNKHISPQNKSREGNKNIYFADQWSLRPF